MKRKLYLAALVMCAALAVNGCGNDKETKDTDTKTEQSTEDTSSDTADSADTEDTTEDDSKSADADTEENTGSTRLVSVDNVDKYIILADYKGVVLDNSVEEVTDDSVDTRVTQNLQAKSEEVTDENATVENGDTATINFVGTKDGVAFDGGTGNNYDLVIGSGTMIPGFEEGIVGMKKGETKDVTVTFPESYRNTDLAGQEAVFAITVQSFKRAPELTDDWVVANTDNKTVDEYKAAVRTQLEEEAQQTAENNRRSSAWTTIYTNSEVVEYPEKDIEEASQTFRDIASTYAQQANMELDEFIESQGISSEDFDAQCQQYAQAKVKQDLIIQGIMDAEGMTFDDAESLAIQNDLVEQYASGDLATLIDTYGQAAVDESIGLIRVQDFIIANAKEADETTAEDSEEATEDDTDAADTSSTDAEAADSTDASTDTKAADDTEDSEDSENADNAEDSADAEKAN